MQVFSQVQLHVFVIDNFNFLTTNGIIFLRKMSDIQKLQPGDNSLSSSPKSKNKHEPILVKGFLTFSGSIEM